MLIVVNGPRHACSQIEEMWLLPVLVKEVIITFNNLQHFLQPLITHHSRRHVGEADAQPLHDLLHKCVQSSCDVQIGYGEYEFGYSTSQDLPQAEKFLGQLIIGVDYFETLAHEVDQCLDEGAELIG